MDEEALQERWAINEKFIGQVVQSLVGLKNDKNNKKSKGSVATLPVSKVKPDAPKVKKVKFTPSPVIEDGNFIFSKFDLLQNSQERVKKEDKFKKVRKDKKLKASLHKIQNQEEKVKKLIQKGETDKAIQFKNQKAWNNALEKAEGKKIYDDPKRIANSLKKHKKVKQKHAKEWAQRKKQVEVKIKKRQEKRERNINKMKMNKKKNKKNKKR